MGSRVFFFMWASFFLPWSPRRLSRARDKRGGPAPRNRRCVDLARPSRRAAQSRTFPFGWQVELRDSLDLHRGWDQRRQFLRHALTNPLEHGRAAWQHDIGVQILADVNVALHDALERSVVDPTGFFTDETWLEQHFCATETFGADSDDVSVWELVGLLLV